MHGSRLHGPRGHRGGRVRRIRVPRIALETAVESLGLTSLVLPLRTLTKTDQRLSTASRGPGQLLRELVEEGGWGRRTSRSHDVGLGGEHGGRGWFVREA